MSHSTTTATTTLTPSHWDFNSSTDNATDTPSNASSDTISSDVEFIMNRQTSAASTSTSASARVVQEVLDSESDFFADFDNVYKIQLAHILHTAPHEVLLKAQNSAYTRLYNAVNKKPGGSYELTSTIHQDLHKDLLTAHQTLLSRYMGLKLQLTEMRAAYANLHRNTRAAWTEAARVFELPDRSFVRGVYAQPHPIPSDTPL
ncbi:hypothetical protein FB451DRAFT_1411965 [Mycena latifolia]|nr:hypothetical protein FB451DRAFT_1411965 [Mycena latifolia]